MSSRRTEPGQPSIAFRSLERTDFARLARWLADPVVHRWWFHESSPEAVERDFGAAVDGLEPGEVFLVLDADLPVGLIQRYLIASSPEYTRELAGVCALAPGALSIDYLIGEPDHRGRRFGTAMIGAFVAASWAAYPDSVDVVVPVAAANRASWRALERAGFSRIAEGELTPDNPADPRDHVVYRIGRPA